MHVHVCCGVLLFYGIARRQMSWVWLAFALKTVVDGVAVFAQSWGVGTAGRLWVIEACLLALGLVALWGIWQTSLRYRDVGMSTTRMAGAPTVAPVRR